jgi:hypothetical protein
MNRRIVEEEFDPIVEEEEDDGSVYEETVSSESEDEEDEDEDEEDYYETESDSENELDEDVVIVGHRERRQPVRFINEHENYFRGRYHGRRDQYDRAYNNRDQMINDFVENQINQNRNNVQMGRNPRR